MKESVLNLTVLCFSIGAEIITRIILIIINSMVYQSFVIAEVLMNNYAVLYPQYISDIVNEVRAGCYYIIYFMLRTASKKLVLMHVWLRWCCRALVSLSWVIVYPLTYLLSIRRNRKCPPPANPLLMKSATTLVSMIAKRQVTSEEVVSAYIERCKEVNPYLNAIVEPRYDAALREARYIDKMVASNERTPEQLIKEFPLLGVPMTVKESIAVEGMSNDCGTVYPVRNPAKKDADIVKRARAAGAIPIAVTNTPQLCMNWETYNNVTGLTMNPYDQKRTTGGSSGGECALLASAASVIGVGSDIAGSLRLPPMFNGVFGHKPTPRLLSVEGHNPDCLDPEFEEYFALGPMARYAEDLTLMLRVLRHPSGPQVPLEKPVDIKRLKFYYMEYDESYITNKIGHDVKKAFDKARAYMKHTHGIEVEKLKIKNVGDMFEISVRVLFNIQHIKNIYTDPENRTGWVSLWPNVLKKMFGLSDHSLTAVCYGVVKKFFDILPKSSYNNILKKFEEIKQDFDRALSDDAVLLFPTYPAPAHLHYRVFSKFLNCGYLTIFNCLGLPATACPMGLTDSGLPVGLQIVANKNNDHLTIAVAKEFEMAFGGWVPPNKQSMITIKTA